MTDSKNIRFVIPGLDWNAYKKFRPAYPDSLFSQIYEYHKRHCDRWDVVHDAGSGAGIVASVLAERFATVNVSDPNGVYLAAAKKNLNQLDSKAKFVFHQSTAEDQSWLEANSLDMFTLFCAMGWVDLDETIREVSRVLKPGATFTSVHYNSWPAILDNPAAVAAWADIVEPWVTKNMKEGDAVAKRAFRNFWTGVDGIPLPKDVFEDGATRIKINEKYRIEADKVKQFPEFGFLPSAVRETDIMVEEENIDEWTKDYTLADFKGFVGTIAHAPDGPDMDRVWERLEQAMQQSQQKTLKVFWSTHIALATKRK